MELVNSANCGTPLPARSNLERSLSRYRSYVRQSRALIAAKGLRAITGKLSAAAGEWLAPSGSCLPVKADDILRANLSSPEETRTLPLGPFERPSVNWVSIPAKAGSGGHTTMFRIIRHLEALGFENRLYFYNVYDADLEYYADIARESYGFWGKIGEIVKGMEDAHAVVATSWPTAYPVFNSLCLGKRFYFVQDFEPSFYPTSSLSLLAENTYKMRFHGITAGRWLSSKLQQEYGMSADPFDFGCDTDVYKRDNSFDRSGIVFYARQETARRGFELGMMALEIFARRHPDVTIHLYGGKVVRPAFPCRNHGIVSPQELNKIYNQCFAGLSISLTNVSLVPHEMIASGCIPIVNEGIHNRIVLDNEFVHYAEPDPHSLAAALSNIMNLSDRTTLSRRAAKSVSGSSWEAAANTVSRIIRSVIAPV